MAGKIIINVESPKTQSIDAIKALLSWRGRASDPLPSFIEMGSGDSRLVLVLSNKKDCFYVATARDCSCPARNWHPNGPCKHMRKHFPEQQQRTTTERATIGQPNHGAWHGRNGPVIEDDERPLAAKAATPDANPREIAYHSIKADREMWPAEA